MDEDTKQAIALAREYYEKHEYDLAERQLEKVAEATRGFADMHNMRGVIHHDRGRLEQARDEFEQALAINPSYTEAALNLAVTYNDLGNYEDAQRVYKSTVHRNGATSEAIDPFAKGKIANLHAELAQAYLDVGLPNEAVQEYRNAIRLCPDFADLRVKLAAVYQQMGDLSAARFELGEAIRVRPRYIPARVAMGVLLLITGHRHKAIEEWEEALRREPDNKSARMYLRMAQNPPSVTEPPGRPNGDDD
jgi:tetratricopeptide (TPR) repeat protein